jgi:hypothetical protein
VCRVLLQPRRPELRHPCPVVHCTDRLGKLPTKPPACEKKRIGDEIEVEESERVGSGGEGARCMGGWANDPFGQATMRWAG